MLTASGKAAMARIGHVIREVYRRPGIDALAGYQRHAGLTAGELDRLEGVLWIRPLWLAAWQCWLLCVSPKVSMAYVPDRDYITALAGQVRKHSGGLA